VSAIQARLIRRAAELMGGEDELARLLNVVPSHLALWISGEALLPDDVFLKVADIITAPPGARNELCRRLREKMPTPIRCCPFCSAPALTFVEIDDNRWAVTCDSCDAIGPHRGAEQDQRAAVKRWNNRTG
jgi:hypothetical protein